jgi:hypothetical protein
MQAAKNDTLGSAHAVLQEQLEVTHDVSESGAAAAAAATDELQNSEVPECSLLAVQHKASKAVNQ